MMAKMNQTKINIITFLKQKFKLNNPTKKKEEIIIIIIEQTDFQ